jgi:hypothetical protein
MKRALIAIALAVVAPALAQAPGATQIEVEGRALLDRWILLFNRGEAVGLVKDVYSAGDEAALAATFTALRSDSFGKLDIYSAAFCGSDATHGKAILKFGRLYTFGGLMDGDEAKVFDLVKTDAGWRIGGETSVAYETVLSCS